MTTSLTVSPSRISQNISTVNFIIDGFSNDLFIISVKHPNGGVDYPYGNSWNSDNSLINNEVGGTKTVSYSRNGGWLLGSYEVTVNLRNDNFDQIRTVTKIFEVLTEEDFNTPHITNYPSTIRQMDRFTWTVDNAKPGESLSYTEVGPVTINHTGIVMEANYEYDPPSGYSSPTSQFEYAGDYIVTFNFSRSKTISRTITVTPKIYMSFPENSIETVPFTYTITGGDSNETWFFDTTGPLSLHQTGTLDSNGSGTFTYVLSQAGTYEIIFTFAKSGKIKKNIVILTNTRIGIHPIGTPIAYSEIYAEFLSGYDLDQYRNLRWYISVDDPSWDLNQGLGNFNTYDLSFYQFYSKRAIDPVVPGQSYYGNPGSYTWTVPANRNGITVEGWGGGGGTGGGPWGENTIISAGNYYMVAGGGETGGGGGRRYGAPPGRGGIASGGTVNINGEGGSWSSAYGDSGRGGNSPFGGTGGAPRGVNRGSNNGNAPGGGSSGNSGRDYSSDPAFGYSSGGGGGAYVSVTVPLKRGRVIAFNVGNGHSGGAPGAVRITWS